MNKDRDDDSSRELIVIIQQEGFELDWQETEELLAKRQILLQKEVYSRFIRNAYDSLFYLGFSDQSAAMTDSVHFLRNIASAFIKALSKTPDIEFLREKTVVEPESKVAEHILNNAPYMNGMEYLSRDWVIRLWSELNTIFSMEVRTYEGSISDYFTSKSPDIHLAGRIFFHLVESKKGTTPLLFWQPIPLIL